MIPQLALMVGGSVIQGLMQDRAAAKQIKAQNKLAIKQNHLNQIEADNTVLGLEVQRGVLRQQTAKTLDLANRAAQGSTGTVTAAAAAAYTKGATVDAILGDVEADYQARKYEVEQDYLNQDYDIVGQGVNVYAQNKMGMAQIQKARSNLGAHVAGGLMQAADSYATQYFKFGSGTDNSSTKPAVAKNYSTRYDTTA